MLAKSDKFSGGYYCGPFEPPGELEGSGSSGRIDNEIAVSEESSTPTRKCIGLNLDKGHTFGVARQVLSLPNMLQSERKDLIHRLSHELEQIRMLQKKVELQRTNGVSVSSSSDFLSCSDGQNLPHVLDFQKSSIISSWPGNKNNPSSGKACKFSRDVSGRFESVKHASAANTTHIILMKQCEGLLKRLMNHQYGWVFNKPVDIVKLNIPDYFNVIKHPMDLGTVKKKIASGAYASPLEFHADVRLTFSNAMTYNPPGNDAHVMADTLNKFFEVRWKNIEKKLPVTGPQLVQSKAPVEGIETSKTVPPAKRRKTTSVTQEVLLGHEKRMTDEEKHNLGRELESLLAEMPMHIIDFLKEHGSNGAEPGEEIEIDIDNLSDNTLFSLRKLLDDYVQEKQKNRSRAEPCEIELQTESGLSNSSLQQGKGNDQAGEDVDIGGNDPPVEIEKDTGHRNSKSVSPGSTRGSDIVCLFDSEPDGAKVASPVEAMKVLEAADSGAPLDEKTCVENHRDSTECVSVLDQPEHTYQPKPSSVESDACQDGDSAPVERHISPEKLYRAALLKKKFADTIIKAREKTLTQGEKGDPEQLRREREELEQQRKKEKARLQAEAKAAEDAQRRAVAEAAAEARRKRELEREAARQALLKVEKTIEINENARFLEDLEMLRTAPASSADEASPDNSQDGLDSFKFGGCNPLEQLGLFMKDDEGEEDDDDQLPQAPNPVNAAAAAEEGEMV
ncbi:global transcription factor group E8 [Hibiscus trionum]|uniref:Global transcription factor group E8 n=1 Tax=Hibiscus trionum TaxID=183268 RepID=A0A9W7J9P2_HIBTR|nr:global transcription factor group E8 [Hibiscus trionum]